MPYSCGIRNTVGDCRATPVVGFGSSVFGDGGYGGYARGRAGTVPAGSLGVLRGAHVDCINQIPPQQAVVAPPRCHITVPGYVLAAHPQPLLIGANNPSANPGISTGGFEGFGFGALGGYGGLGSLGDGIYGFGNAYNSRGSLCLGRRYSVCN